MDKKKFLRLKKKVLYKYPNASTKVTPTGKFYVSDGIGSYVGEEFLIPPQDTVTAAWYWASETIKTSQNIERTHPDKMEFESDEKKFMRLSRRNRKK